MSRQLAQSYKRHPVTEDYDAIVIGSGIGGLAAAAMLAKHGGKRVLVLERHYTPGGYTHVFHRPGYDWDVGVHYIGDVAPGSTVRRLFDDISDGRIEWADMGEVYDRVIIGGDVYDLPKGRRNLRDMLVSRFPAEEAAIDGYFEAVRAAVSASLPFQAAKTLPAPIQAQSGQMTAHAPSPRWARPHHPRGARGAHRRPAADRGADRPVRRLRAAPGASPASRCTRWSSSHYFRGGYYPVGGSGVIAESIIPVIERAGGLVLINAEVAEVVVEDGRAVGVRMAADGHVIRAPIVISDAGVLNTFGELLPRDVAERAGLLADLTQVAPSMAHLCLYLGFEETAEALDLPKHNLWIYPNEDYEQTIEDSSADPEAALPMVYVSFPAAKDPDFERRHPGRSTVEVITAAPYAWFEQWEGSRWKHRGAEYDAFKDRLAERMLEALYRADAPAARQGRVLRDLDAADDRALRRDTAAASSTGSTTPRSGSDQDFLKPATPDPGAVPDRPGHRLLRRRRSHVRRGPDRHDAAARPAHDDTGHVGRRRALPGPLRRGGSSRPGRRRSEGH